MPMALLSMLVMPFGLEALPLAAMGWGVDWMISVAKTIAGWSEGWGGVRAAPATALLLFVAGFLWLALWGERWRIAGIVPMLVAVPVALLAPRPDILVDAGGRTAAVRGADGRYSVIGAQRQRDSRRDTGCGPTPIREASTTTSRPALPATRSAASPRWPTAPRSRSA